MICDYGCETPAINYDLFNGKPYQVNISIFFNFKFSLKSYLFLLCNIDTDPEKHLALIRIRRNGFIWILFSTLRREPIYIYISVCNFVCMYVTFVKICIFQYFYAITSDVDADNAGKLLKINTRTGRYSQTTQNQLKNRFVKSNYSKSTLEQVDI